MIGESASRNLDDEVAEIIMELPQGFSVGERRFYLYPISLGKSYFIGRLMGRLGIDRRILNLNPYVEALRLATEKPIDVCQIIACHTVRSQHDICNNAKMQRRAELFAKELTPEEIAELLALTLAEPPLDDILRHLGIADDHRRRDKVMAAKSPDRNTYIFGGKSIFGALIAPACEKLRMTPRQVVWDISLHFLQTLMADIISQVYLTDEEMKKCRVPSANANVINADDPANLALVGHMTLY